MFYWWAQNHVRATGLVVRTMATLLATPFCHQLGRNALSWRHGAALLSTPIGSSSARLAIDWEEPPPNPARGSAQAAASDERVVRETGGLHLNLAARNVIGHTPCPLVLSRPSCATGNTRLQYVFSDQRGGSSSFQFGI